jgi:alpha/beta superfamily hydrolase
MTHPQPIVANSVLPARRDPIHLRTSDGLTLVGEVAQPLLTDARGTIVCVHPLPTHGGMMDSHVLRKMAWRLPALADLAVVRFNTRGTTSAAGTSDGSFDDGNGEGRDLQAALDEVARRGLPDPWLLGWSFGTDVVLKHGNVDPVLGAILLSPPLRYSVDDDLVAWHGSGRSVVAFVPEFDDYLVPEDAARRFAVLPEAEVVAVPEAKHLWVGERFVKLLLDGVVERVAPEMSPLPIEWSGPMDRWSDI